jgi:sugar lactone lactonase YvrE
MLKSFEVRPVLDGLKFAEGPRWRDGRLWFSDIEQGRVMALDDAGRVQIVAEIERPSGLGFLPDGALLVAGMRSRALFRVDGADVAPYADLTAMGSSVNDMVVTGDGRAYVDCYRPGPPFTPLAGPDGSPHGLGGDINRYYVNGLGVSPSLVGDIVLVTPDRSVRTVATGMSYPNGLGIAPDGRTLVASISHESRLIAFDIQPDGGLSAARLWADLPGRHPDGLCFDAEGAVWVASVATSAFLRVLEGGEITHLIPAPGRWAVSLALGGEDRRTLYMITMEPADLPNHRSWISAARVDVPGAGLP